MPRKKKTPPQLNIIFDTNVLYASVAYYLVRSEVRHLIQANSHHPDLSVNWYMPEIVIDERRYQMQAKAFELLPPIEKLEKLLGHNLNITKDILTNRINEAIEKQLNELGISTLRLDTSLIDWKDLIKRSVYRYPPFQPGSKEKGFRDSLIAETFLQLVNKSPSTPSFCRHAVVTNDGLLTDYVKERTVNTKNVRVMSDISELESLINTLVSKITEEFAAELFEMASKYFFEPNDKNTLYYKENIGGQIQESYGEALSQVPRADLIRENGTWFIDGPIFVKKERQRIFWTTPIRIEAKLMQYEFQNTSATVATLASIGLGLEGADLGRRNVLSDFGRGGADLGRRNVLKDLGLKRALEQGPTKMEVSGGESLFEVHWSVNVTQAKRLTSPRIEKIHFISTKWSEE